MTSEETMETMYCSKYALTTGITEHKGKRTSDGERFEPEGWSCTYWMIGRDVHETREAARATAERTAAMEEPWNCKSEKSTW